MIKSKASLNRKCFSCKQPAKYVAANGKAHCGDVECGIELHKLIKAKQLEKQAKQERKEIRARKAKLNDTVPYWTKKAQAAFNAYIRERDKDKPCISCGLFERPNSGLYRGAGSWDAGHFRSIGSCPELRFEESNCHRQHSRPCNKDLSGDTINYERHLVERIGQNAVDWLKGPHEPKRYRVEELKEICEHFKNLTKQLKQSNR